MAELMAELKGRSMAERRGCARIQASCGPTESKSGRRRSWRARARPMAAAAGLQVLQDLPSGVTRVRVSSELSQGLEVHCHHHPQQTNATAVRMLAQQRPRTVLQITLESRLFRRRFAGASSSLKNGKGAQITTGKFEVCTFPQTCTSPARTGGSKLCTRFHWGCPSRGIGRPISAQPQQTRHLKASTHWRSPWPRWPGATATVCLQGADESASTPGSKDPFPKCRMACHEAAFEDRESCLCWREAPRCPWRAAWHGTRPRCSPCPAARSSCSGSSSGTCARGPGSNAAAPPTQQHTADKATTTIPALNICMEGRQQTSSKHMGPSNTAPTHSGPRIALLSVLSSALHAHLLGSHAAAAASGLHWPRPLRRGDSLRPAACSNLGGGASAELVEAVVVALGVSDLNDAGALQEVRSDGCAGDAPWPGRTGSPRTSQIGCTQQATDIVTSMSTCAASIMEKCVCNRLHACSFASCNCHTLCCDCTRLIHKVQPQCT